MEDIHFSCQGESHKAINKVCQDYSYSNVYENGVAIAVVCDGHGGQRYFRSDVGAKFACETTVKNVGIFIENIDSSLFIGRPYTTAAAIATQVDNSEFNKESKEDKAFRQLFSSIIYDWTVQVREHAENNPITDAEKEGLQEKWVSEFNEGQSLEKVYGCTLMAYVQTQDYWFAFHIGDGKCISFDEKVRWKEPIPWDDRCFLNRTTSLCDAQAIDEFRYCYQGNGEYPMAIFLASDGIDDSFGEEKNQVNFYIQILKKLKDSTKEEVYEEIASTLPQLSKIGSQDDMSISMIYDEEKVRAAYPLMLEWQIDTTKSAIEALNAKIDASSKKMKQLENVGELTRNIKIEYDYAQSDMEKALTEKSKLIKRYNTLSKELYGEDYTPYDIGLTENNGE
jgi:hypothetical protein